MARFLTQKITSGDKTQINYAGNGYESMTFTNTHSDAVSISLYVTSQIGNNITDTGTNANESDNSATTNSVTLTVDGTAATADVFLNEKVWKSDGTLFGTCTARNSNTEIVFADGVKQTLADDADLYTGTRYYILKNVEIPVGVALQLHPEDFNFEKESYNFYIQSSNASGLIDIITR